MPEDVPLNRIERFAVRFAEIANKHPRGKWLQTQLLRGVSYVWVRAAIARRILVGVSTSSSRCAPTLA